jgi:archaellum component FlaC
MEDALKRLDKLTQEEARMAVAQNLRATHTVDERVKGVANTMVAIDNRVAGVDDRVTSVDDRVARVDDNVKGIDARVGIVGDSVKVVDDKVAEVIHGAKGYFQSNLRNLLIRTPQTERKQSKSLKKLIKSSMKQNKLYTKPPTM